MLTPETQALIDQFPEHLRGKVRALVEHAINTEKPADITGELEFLLGVDVSESDFGAWQDTDANWKLGHAVVPTSPKFDSRQEGPGKEKL